MGENSYLKGIPIDATEREVSRKFFFFSEILI